MTKILKFLNIVSYIFIASLLVSCGSSTDPDKDVQTGIYFLADKVTPKTELYHSDTYGKYIQRLNHVLPENSDINNFAVSPNGKYVAYSATNGLGTPYELYVAHSNGSSAYKVSGIFPLSNLSGVSQFSWSPNSTRLAYLATSQDNNVQKTLYLISMNNEASINVTPQTKVDSFRWSPDSKHISYMGEKLNVTNSLGIYVLDKDNQTEVKVSGDLLVNELVYPNAYNWSPNGLHLNYLKLTASAATTEMFAVSLDGTENTNLSKGLSTIQELWAWAPDSSRLAYSLDQDTTGVFEVFTVRPNGTDIKKVSKPLNLNEDSHEFYWAPNSSRIVYLIYNNLALTNELYTATFDGLQQTKISGPLATGESIYSWSTAWSPDNQWISYSANPGQTNSQLFIVKPDGTNLISVTNSEIFNNNVYANPIWSPDSNNIAFQVDVKNEVKLYTFNLNNLTLTKLSKETIFGINPNTYRSVKWYKDGKNLVYKAVTEVGFLGGLYSGSMDTGLETNITGHMNFISTGKYDIR